MGEGISSGGRQVAAGVKGGRPPQPEPDEERAPLGWTWDAAQNEWRPKKKRGRKPSGSAADTPESAAEPSSGWQAERDPEPARLRDERPAQRTAIPVTAEVRDNIAGLMGLLGATVLPPVAQLDPICGGALIDSWPKIADACMPLLCRSQVVVRFVSAGGGLGDWAGLAIALAPVATAIMQHHVLKTIRLEENPDGMAPAAADFAAFPAA